MEDVIIVLFSYQDYHPTAFAVLHLTLTTLWHIHCNLAVGRAFVLDLGLLMVFPSVCGNIPLLVGFRCFAQSVGLMVVLCHSGD